MVRPARREPAAAHSLCLVARAGRDAVRPPRYTEPPLNVQRIDGLYQIVLTQRVGFPGGGAAAMRPRRQSPGRPAGSPSRRCAQLSCATPTFRPVHH